MLHTQDTIVALSTPPGRSAIAVIRISGSNTIPILKKILRKPNNILETFDEDLIYKNKRRLNRCYFFCGEEVIDDGMYVFFSSPHSYTGEDMAEFYVHGNPIIVKKIINFISNMGLARPSLPGEFTRRSFFNGKMDLTKAESIHRIIMARSEYELNATKKIYFGELYKRIHKIRSEIILLKAQIEAEIDFSDQDIEYSEKQTIIKKIQEIQNLIDSILKNSTTINKMISGFQIVLIGKTNAGKSSLLNKILGWDRSIVSDIEGTTRDYIAEEIEILGFPVRIVDTAGLRETQDQIEREGIKRSREAMERSNIILHLIDGSIPEYPFISDIEQILSIQDSLKIILHVINKKDCLHPEAWNPETLEKYFNQKVRVLYISCKTGEGIDELKQTIENIIKNQFQLQDPFLLEERQLYHFTKIKESLNQVIELWNMHAPEEIVAIEVQNALNHIAELTGEITTEDVLGRIFSMFCIGK